MDKPKVSIAVAIYNSEKFLRQCVDSLVNQSLEEIEIILVSDASPDNSLEIMQEYAQKYPDKVKIFESKENLRAGGARNIGLSMANGEYYGYVDADDYVDTSICEKLYSSAKENDADVSCSYICNFDDYIGRRENRDYSGGFSRIIRRQMLIDNDIRFPEKIMYEDIYFWGLVQKLQNKRIEVKEYLYFAREQSGSVRHTTTRRTIEDRLKVQEMLLEELLKRELEVIPISNEVTYNTLKLYCANTYYLFALSVRLDFELIRFYVESCNKLIRNYFPDYNKNKQIKKQFPITERFLLFTLKNAKWLAKVLVFLSSTVLKWIRNVKRFFQSKKKK